MMSDAEAAWHDGLTLSGAEKDTVWQLFRNGPTWDGNLVSKTARDALLKRGWVEAYNGWQWLTRYGVLVALGLSYDRRKDKL